MASVLGVGWVAGRSDAGQEADKANLLRSLEKIRRLILISLSPEPEGQKKEKKT
jgi:hypothetical protein